MLKRALLALFVVASLHACSTEEDVAQTEAPLTLRTDYALGKPTLQSSTAFGGDSSRAVDGNTSGVWTNNSVTHTDYNTHAWWQVDLLQNRPIDIIQIWGRTDPCCVSRLSNYWVLTSSYPMSYDLSTALADPNVTKHYIPGQSALPMQAVGIYTSARYVRVQLAYSDYLSLAEVQVLDAPNEIPGPDAIAAKTTWTATGTVTSSNAFAMVEVSDSLRTYQRGADGLLQESTDVGAPHDVAGSPAITSDGVSAVTDPATGHTFVVARATDGYAAIAERDPTTSSWTWREVWPTDGAPAVAVGCNQVYLAVRNQGSVLVFARSIPGIGWGYQSSYAGVRTPPALAAAPNGDVGLAYVTTDNWIYFARATCARGGVMGSAISPWGTSPSATRVGIVAYGDLFGVAVQGMDNLPYFAMQSYDANNQPTWSGFESIDRPVALIESPTLVVYRDLIFMAARDTQNQLRYWVRDPNFQTRISGQVIWTGGNVVSGFGTGATPPAFSTRGTRELFDNYSYLEHPESELYVATKGIGDQQIYALNFGRFATYDVLHNVLGVQFDTAFEANDVDPRIVGDFPDLLPGFLQFPSAYWWTMAHPAPCNGIPLTITITTNVIAGHEYPQCTAQYTSDGRTIYAPGVMLYAKGYPAWTFSEELGHIVQYAVPGFKTQPGYAVNFGVIKPRLCTSNADCGGGTCAPACADPSNCAPNADTYGSTYVCQNPGYGSNRIRPMGFVDWYDTTEDEHSFIDLVEWYRWWGDELREMRDLDLAEGNTMLRDKYAWVKAYYFGGVEFRGRHTSIPASGRPSGAYGFPLH